MGTGTPRVPVPILGAVDAVPRVVTFLELVCLLEAFDGLINKWELDQASTCVVKWGCWVKGSLRCAACVIGVVWFRGSVSDLQG